MQAQPTQSPAMISNQPPATLVQPQSLAVTNTATIVSMPFCDRLVMRAYLSVAHVAKLAAANKMPPEKFLMQCAHNFRDGIRPSWGLGFKAQRKRTPGYEASQIALGPSQSMVSFGIGKFSKESFGVAFRLELNPAHLGPAGLQQIEAMWDALLCCAIPFEHFLACASVNRIDVAIDVVGTHIADLYIVARGKNGSLDPKAKSAGKWPTWHATDGRLETVSQFSGGKKPKCIFSAYNKRQELLDTGGAPQHGDAPHTRLERKLRSQKMEFRYLPLLSNPFQNIGVIDLIAACPPADSMWRLFVDSVHVRSLPDALDYVPPSMRDKWRTALELASDADWWHPESLWAEWIYSFKNDGLAGWILRANSKAQAFKLVA